MTSRTITYGSVRRNDETVVAAMDRGVRRRRDRRDACRGIGFMVGLAMWGEPRAWLTGTAILVLAMSGGAIEGLAVGSVQWALLRGWLPGLTALAWVGATTAVAVVGWALGTFPSVLITIFGGEETSHQQAPSRQRW